MRKEPEPQAGSRMLSFGDLLGRLAFDQFAHGLPDDVVHDVGGRVIDAAGFLDLRLVLHHGAVALGEADDLAEKLLIDLAEDVGGDDGEYVRAVGVVEAAQDVAQELVVEVQREGQFVGRFVAALLRLEVEQAGVVAVVGRLEQLAEARVDAVAVDQRAEAAVVLDAAVFADAEEDDAVNDALDGEVEFALGEPGIAEGEVAGQFLAASLRWSRGKPRRTPPCPSWPWWIRRTCRRSL